MGWLNLESFNGFHSSGDVINFRNYPLLQKTAKGKYGIQDVWEEDNRFYPNIFDLI